LGPMIPNVTWGKRELQRLTPSSKSLDSEKKGGGGLGGGGGERVRLPKTPGKCGKQGRSKKKEGGVSKKGGRLNKNLQSPPELSSEV